MGRNHVVHELIRRADEKRTWVDDVMHDIVWPGVVLAVCIVILYGWGTR